MYLVYTSGRLVVPLASHFLTVSHLKLSSCEKSEPAAQDGLGDGVPKDIYSPAECLMCRVDDSTSPAISWAGLSHLLWILDSSLAHNRTAR